MTHLNWFFFCENSLYLKVVKSLEKKLNFKTYQRVLNLPQVFFSDLHLLQKFFLLLAFLNINETSTLHTNVYLETEIQQQCLSGCLDVLVNFGQIFALVLSTFNVEFQYYSFIVNATLWHILVNIQKMVIFMGVIANCQFPPVQCLALWGFLQRYLSIACYDDVIFKLYYLYWEK